MIESKVARRYAKSLFGLALERNVAEVIYKDMELLHATCAVSRELVALLRNPIVQSDKKASIIKALFGSKVNDLTNSFMNIVIDKHRESDLNGIAGAYIQFYKDYKGIVTAHIATPVAMDAAMRETILNLVKKSKGDEVELIEEVDPSLIGGFVLTVGDEQHDTSISRKITMLKREYNINLYVKDY
jgi:F-type H+-transporting ATPase subunit delta